MRCHLLPQALTRPAETRGKYFIEAGGGARAIGRRWNSWYDEHLVCAAGESRLARFDDRGVKALRFSRLVWSGWGAGEKRLADDTIRDADPAYGLRRVEGVKGNDLRWFFLSLLWRAAATHRPEFSEISMPDDDVERMRRALIGEDPPPLSFYPVILLQYTTRADHHNRGPIRWRGPPGPDSPKFKFYIDGLAGLVFGPDTNIEPIRSLIVGAEPDLLVQIMEFERSEQFENLKLAVREAYVQGVVK